MYKALKDFASAEKYYKDALEGYELDPEKSSETIALMKNLLESIIQQLPEDTEPAKTLAEADALVARILIKTRETLRSSEPSDDGVPENKTIGETYQNLSDIYGIVKLVIVNKVKELAARSKTDNKLKEAMDKIKEMYINGELDYTPPNDLTPEQRKFWDETAGYLKIDDAVSKRIRSLSNVGKKIQAVAAEYDNSLKFEKRRALAGAYAENGECAAKALKIVEKLYAERDPKADDAATKEQAKETPLLVLRNLKILAGFYDESLHDDAKAAALYDEWSKAFKERISDNANFSDEEKSNEGKDHAGFYIEIGKFYYQRGDYAKAQLMFNEYHKFAEKNDAYLSPTVSANEWNRPKVLLTRIQLDILTARAVELKGNKDAAIAQYGNLLSRVQNWISRQKELEKTINTSQYSNTANVANINPANTTGVSANVAVNSNVTNTATNANKAVAPYTPQYLTALYKEAALYEAYLRIRLADLYFSTGKAENVQNQDLLNARSHIVFGAQTVLPAFMIEGYISGLKNIARSKQVNAEQSALYYQYAIEGLNVASSKVYGSYSETYLRYKTLSKEFYDDYVEVLTSFDQLKPPTPERVNKLNTVRKKREKALTFKELEKPFICTGEPVQQMPGSNLTARRQLFE
jgi:hypothetical protein